MTGWQEKVAEEKEEQQKEERPMVVQKVDDCLSETGTC